MPIKGSVNVTVTVSGDVATITFDPPTGLLDRHIQVMQWSLIAPAGVKFGNPGIIFINTDLPAGFSPWTGSSPVNENDWQVRADANHQAAGPDPVKYRYNLNLEGLPSVQIMFADVSGTLIDPDMENQPQP